MEYFPILLGYLVYKFSKRETMNPYSYPYHKRKWCEGDFLLRLGWVSMITKTYHKRKKPWKHKMKII